MPNFQSPAQFNKIPVIGFVPESTSTAPSSPVLGQLYTDTSTSKNYWWNGSAWLSFDDVAAGAITNAKVNASAAIARSKLDFGSGLVNADIASGAAIAYNKLSLSGSVTNSDLAGSISYNKLSLTGAIVNNDLAGSIALSKLATDPLARANHTGTQAASTISDLASTVKAYRLDEFASPTAAVSAGSQQVTNVADGTVSHHAVNLGQLQAAAAGIDNKPSVRAATTANVNLSSALVNGATVDGVTVSTGDRVLVKSQSTATENGLYVVAASGAASRTSDTLTANSFVFVEDGSTLADTQWMITNNGTITIGSTNITWSQFGSAGSSYTADGQGIEVSANQFSLELASNSGLSKSSSGLTVASSIAGAGSAWSSGVINVGAGTGITVNADDVAVNTSVVARKVISTGSGGWTGGSAKTFTHSLGNQWVTCQVYITSSGEQVLADVIAVDANSLTVTVAANQSAGYYTVVMVG